MKILTVLIGLFTATPALCEYRVYQYLLKNKVVTQSDTPGNVIQSTLDPVSFLAYHGGSQMVSLSLLRTWICPGHTGKNLPLCKSPYAELPSEVLQ